jgi:hypothetical protein
VAELMAQLFSDAAQNPVAVPTPAERFVEEDADD